MQTFLPYPSFRESAKCLDNKRLGKQRAECLQILNALKGKYVIICERGHKLRTGTLILGHCMFCDSTKLKAKLVAWYNHPAVKMWRGTPDALADYSIEICIEWRKRGFRDKCLEQIPSYRLDYLQPFWLGNSDFHLSHKSNLIRKFPEHYIPIFGSDIPKDLPYVWPVK